MTISQIIEELNLDNGSNYKMEVLEKHKDNEVLKRVLKMTYDKVSFTFGISMKNIQAGSSENTNTLEWALDILENDFCTRNITGNKAIGTLETILESQSENNRIILENIINRDQRINMGRSNINKVFKNLIVKPPYTRCEIGTAENIKKNIDFSKTVYSQKKEDGTFRRAVISGDTIEITSRPGIVTEFPIIEEQLMTLGIDGYVMIGEMTLRGEKDRKKGNGLINSDNPPHSDIIYTIWDMIPIHEYSMDKKQIKVAEKAGTLSKYEDRFNLLTDALAKVQTDNINLIESRIITSMGEAYEHFQELTSEGFEGTVIKAHDMTHKDGNSKKQLKVKKILELDMRCTGFTEGKKGTSREQFFGAMTFQNDEGTIKGQCSGFTDALLEEINSNRENYIGKVFTITCNDITKAKNKNTYALSHGNFLEWRSKDETDNLQRAIELSSISNY